MSLSFQDVYLYCFAALTLSIALLKSPLKTNLRKEIDASSNYTIINYGKKRGCFITGCALFLLFCSLIGPYIAITEGNFTALLYCIPLIIISIIVLLPSKYHGKFKLPTPLILKKIGILVWVIGLFYWSSTEIIHALANHEIYVATKVGGFIANINKYPFPFWYTYLVNCAIAGYIIYFIRSHILSEYFPPKDTL
jgi:hypothetical protein